MAGYRHTVCLPGEARDRLEEAVGEAMAPFWLDRDGDISLDLRIWDSWRIQGGVERSGYRVRPGHEADPRIVHDHPRWDGTREDSEPGWCAGGPRGLLVVRGSSERTAALGGAAWDRWQEILRAHPPARPWSEFRPEWTAGRTSAETEAAFRDAHAAYLAQAPVVPFRRWAAELPVDPAADGFESVLRDIDDPLESFGRFHDRDMCVWHYGRWAAACENVLTLDGWWCEQGEDPLHGACDDPAACPHTPPPMGQLDSAAAYLAGLPDDTLLVSVRCHV
ncbi:hypothetical protein OHA37_06515 [Streptomyces sp. NBC_00335]|uniref:hypothetical protein n=1 Tax=unclassified Streptomyces TaxID=2593676 RepID=UPI00224D3E47|nr:MULTISPECIES: hypothetical protein [unclassified Streptomyces]MCX5403534.1 hypothetical protein [Streptomyces sp. NBC_00086]